MRWQVVAETFSFMSQADETVMFSHHRQFHRFNAEPYLEPNSRFARFGQNVRHKP